MVTSSMLPSSASHSISGQHPRPLNWSLADNAPPPNSMKADNEQKSTISSSSVTRLKISPSLSMSASLSYYYYSPAVASQSTNSTALNNRSARLQRSLTAPETAYPTVAMTSPEIAPGSSVDTSTAIARQTTDGLELTWSSKNSDRGQVAVDNYADRRRADSTPDHRPQRTSENVHVWNAKDTIVADKVVDVEAINTVRSRHSVNSRCSDTSGQTGSNELLAPSGEFAVNNTRFASARQMAAPEPHDHKEPRELLGRRSGKEVVHDNDRVPSHLQTFNIRNSPAALSESETFDVSGDDVFIPDVQEPRLNDNPVGLAVTSGEPQVTGVVVDRTSETRVMEAESAAERDEGLRRFSMDSFNRPDSPMFHRLMDLPRDSVILRNRRRRRRRDSNTSSSSSSSSSSLVLSNHRRSSDSGENTAIPPTCLLWLQLT